MYLFKNKEAFYDAVTNASNALKINESLLEKDYFVMLLLSELNKEIPGLVFKGGTCCSHAYKAINRFSEDIDLSLDLNHFTQKHKISANKTIIKVCDKLGFKIVNRELVEKHSHGSYNCYFVEYPISFSSSIIKPYVQIEMTFYSKCYPSETKLVNSLIGEWLCNTNNANVAEEFSLLPYQISVQTLERTFIDKVFAICDYFERNEFLRNSRHIYDLYMMFNRINFQEASFLPLLKKVREERKKNKMCVSASDEYDINKTLSKIIKTNCFEYDYETVTLLLLTQPLPYKEAITVVLKIIETKTF